MDKIPYNAYKSNDGGFVEVLGKRKLMVLSEKNTKPNSIRKTNDEAISRLDEILEKGKYSDN